MIQVKSPVALGWALSSARMCAWREVIGPRLTARCWTRESLEVDELVTVVPGRNEWFGSGG
jgi:hypothetical protein